jgi:hypothetical protein
MASIGGEKKQRIQFNARKIAKLVSYNIKAQLIE